MVLGQIRLGLPKRFRGRFHQFRCSSSKVSTVVSLVLWGRPVLGCQKVPRSHVSLIRLRSAENDPSCLCCWGILWAYLMESYAIMFHYFIANWNVFPARSSCSPAVAIGVLTSSQGKLQLFWEVSWCHGCHHWVLCLSLGGGWHLGVLGCHGWVCCVFRVFRKTKNRLMYVGSMLYFHLISVDLSGSESSIIEMGSHKGARHWPDQRSCFASAGSLNMNIFWRISYFL